MSIKRLFSVFALSLAIVSAIMAKGVTVPAVYVFGVSFSFNDSTVYFTDIQKIENAWILEKHKMLEGRSAYANQLKTYLGSQGLPNQTCAIYYSFSEKDIEKKYAKVRQRYVNPKKRRLMQYEIRGLQRDSFRFEPVAHDPSTDEPEMTKAERKAANKASREAAKAAKQAIRDRKKAEKGKVPASQKQ